MAGHTLTLYPNPKINLGLFIKGKRSDGYHLLETVLYPINMLFDELYLEENAMGTIEFTVEGIDIDAKKEDNLCVKAYRVMQSENPDLPGINIHLVKHIPAGSGLGGGSSDAAFTLRGINELFNLGYSLEQLAEMGATLGADVPFFLYNRSLLAKGIGTEFEELDIEIVQRIKLITPDIHSSTVEAYKNLDYNQCDPLRDLRTVVHSPLDQWKEHLINDLEVPVFKSHPQIEKIKQELYQEGAVYAAMSGSGSAVFGLFV